MFRLSGDHATLPSGARVLVIRRGGELLSVAVIHRSLTSLSVS
jgi:hypothetical protein